MAEAVADTSSVVPLKFFCHQCKEVISSVLPGYKCPNCNSGFIEEVDDSSSDDSSDEDESMHNSFRLANSFLLEYSRRPPTLRGNGSRGSHTGLARGSLRDVSSPLEMVIHEFFQNLPNNMDMDHDFQAEAPSMILYGTTRDYIFGRGGLDAIITELMNDRDIRGPPPLSKDDIAQIPTIHIEQLHVDKGSECTVCWENYKLSEPVRKLSCAHLFHNDCIVPWLKLNGTCPVCRSTVASVNDDSTPSTSSASRQEASSSAERPSTSSGWFRGAGRSASGFLSSLIGTVSSALNGRSSPPSSSSARVRDLPSRESHSQEAETVSRHPYNLRRRNRDERDALESLDHEIGSFQSRTRFRRGPRRESDSD